MKRITALLLVCLLLAGCGQREVVPPENTSPSVPKDLGYCLALARDMERRYGIRILMGEDAAAQAPWDYEFIPETRAVPLYRQLQALDRNLSKFPESILEDLFSPAVTVCLVEQISGVPGTGSVKTADGLQFSDDNGVTLALIGGPKEDKALYHELYHLMDPKLSFENWNDLNPAGFSYQNSRTSPRDQSLAQGKNRAFIDSYSMSYAREDRARIFEHAMIDGDEALFQSELLQKKLAAICSAIRAVYGDASYPWEQYLN